MPARARGERGYYDVLGAGRGTSPHSPPPGGGRHTSPEEIKKAYRRLAMEFHPDRVPAERKAEAEERFKEISEAYEVLADEEKSRLDDADGPAGGERQVWGGQGFDWSRFTHRDDLEDIFGS